MSLTRRSTLMLPALFFTAAAAAVAQTGTPAATPAAPSRPKKPVYVQDFQGIAQQSSQGPGGPVSRKKESRASNKASQSASALSQAIVKEFVNAGFQAKRLETSAQLPTDGWLVRGWFYVTDSSGKIHPMERTGGEQKPNTQVSVSVSNLSKDPNTPFIVFGTADALRGQGMPAGWNPYVVAAKFLVNRVESKSDLDKLARQIVQTILDNNQIIEEKARSAQ